jgi:hypothetical protein
MVLAISTCSLPLISYSQSSKPLFLVSPGVFFQRLESPQGIMPFFGYGIDLIVFPSDEIQIGASVGFGSPSSEYDLVGSTVSQDLHLSSYQVLAAIQLVSAAGALGLSATGGVGIMTLRSEPHSISAGGFGSITVPSQSDHFTTYSVGLRASSRLSPRVSVYLSPGLLFVSPVRVSSTGYSIGGGMSIGIL